MHKKSTSAIIVAAGKGLRAQTEQPKQYIMLEGKPVIWHTARKFKALYPLVIVAHPDFHEQIQHWVPDALIVEGGPTRTDSVKAGLQALQDKAPDNVLIHDAARPFVSQHVIEGVIMALDTHDASVPTLRIADAVKQYDAAGVLGHDIERDALRAVQTPQGFKYSKIMTAYHELDEGTSFSDDIALAVNAKLSIATTQGENSNFKITYPEDIIRAQNIMKETQTHYKPVTGLGYDVHRIVDGDGMYLCGIRIEGNKTLLGHSDADVGLHAITDAIFGAMSAGDIGDHFPPTDPKWKGAASNIFLKEASRFAAKEGAIIDHIDVTLICEAPKIKPHREAMRARIADIIGIDINAVSVKATTTEKLGFTGRSEGISAQATASVRRPL